MDCFLQTTQDIWYLVNFSELNKLSSFPLPETVLSPVCVQEQMIRLLKAKM